MPIFLYNFFHRETNDKTEGNQLSIPRHDAYRFQKHPRARSSRIFPSVNLPEVKDSFVRDILSQSQFHETLPERQTVNLQVLANILLCGYGVLRKSSQQHRTVPSLGGRYPIGMYVFLFEQLGACRPGLYWYNASEHQLELLVLKFFSLHERRIFAPLEWPVATRVLICLTLFLPLSIEGYGSRGYRYSLFEAGHIAQNMILAGAELGKRCIPLEGISEWEIESTLGLNTDEERVLSAWCL